MIAPAHDANLKRNGRSRPTGRRKIRRHVGPPIRTRIAYDHQGAYEVNLRSGYHAARSARESGRVLASGGSADSHIRWDLRTIRAESQRMDRDNGIFRAAINRGLDNIFGEGFTLQAKTGNRTLNQAIEALWADWSEHPEVRGMDEWADIERMVLRSVWIDGDIGAIKGMMDGTGKLQLIESERIGGAVLNDDMGVELDAFGVPSFFKITDYSRTGQVQSDFTRIPAEDFIFIAHRDRTSQTRGVPLQTSNMPMLHRIGDVLDSEAASWQVLSRIALTIEQEGSKEFAFDTSTEDQSTDLDFSDRVHDLGHALIFHAEPGESVHGVDRNLPGKDFSASITMFLRMIGMPIGLPLELLLLDWSKTNFSSARAALLQSYKMFTRWQRFMMRRWHRPIYRWKVQEWVDAGIIPNRRNIFKHEFIPPPFPWVDPLKEVQAEGTALDRGFTTFDESLRSRNRDRADFIESRRVEIMEAIEAAREVSEDTGENVDWRLFAGLQPDKTAPAMNTNEADNAADPEEQPSGSTDDVPGESQGN